MPQCSQHSRWVTRLKAEMFLFFWKLNSCICKILVLFLICSFLCVIFPLLHFSFLCSFSSSILLLFVFLSFLRVHSLFHRWLYPRLPIIFMVQLEYFRSNCLQSPGIKYISSYSKDRLRINERKNRVLSLCPQGKGELESRLTQIMKEGFYPSSWQNKWSWTRPPTVSNQKSTPKNVMKYVK